MTGYACQVPVVPQQGTVAGILLQLSSS
jgi:hypothetical protein